MKLKQIKSTHKRLKLDNTERHKSYVRAGLFTGSFAVIGTAILLTTHAATQQPAVKATDAQLGGNAILVDNNGAYAGKAIRFQSPPPPPPPKFDLIISDVGLSGTATVGKAQTIWADVKNSGNATSPGGFGVGMYINGGQQTWGWVDKQLAPGESIRVYGSGIMNGDPSSAWYPESTSATVSAMADDTNLQPGESNENNNVFQKTHTFGIEVNASPLAVPTTLNMAWCGPPWDAPQEEFNLAARDNIGMLGPPCQSGGGFIPQTVEQNNIAMDKAAAAGTRILVFGGYTCNNPYDHNCYKTYMDPNAVLDVYPARSGMAGYFVVDEPNFEKFDQIGAVNQTIYRRRPGLIAFTNVFGNVIGSEANYGLGCAPNKCPITFEDYIWNYIYKTRPQIMSYDDYEPSNVVNFRTTSVVLRVLADLQNNYGIPAVRVMTAVPSVTNGAVAKDPNVLWNRYLDLKALANANGSILHFTWRRPPGSEWYGDGECGVARAMLGNVGVPVCGY